MRFPLFSRRALISAVAGSAAATAAGAKTIGQIAHATSQSEGSTEASDPSSLAAGKIPVAVLLDEAATMMDFAGPWEVFQDVAMGGGSGYYLYTVAPKMRRYNTSGVLQMDKSGMTVKGLAFTPDFTVEDAPQPQVVVVGAQMDFAGPEKLAWLRKVAPAAQIMLSICTGNFLMANAGLLDGLKATTHHRFYDMFEKQFPRVELVRDQRFVDNGKFVSGGGITAGIDAALHVARRHFDDKIIQETIKYMEYRTNA